MAVSAFSAITSCIGEFSTPCSEPERIFTRSQPAIADEILGIEVTSHDADNIVLALHLIC